MRKGIFAKAVLLILLCLLLLSGCSSKSPVRLASASLYSLQYDEEKDECYLYLDWKNEGKKTIDSLEITIEGKFGGKYEGEDSIRYRILNADGWNEGEPSEGSSEKLSGLLKGERYTVYLSKAGFSDGSVWRNESRKGKVSLSVNGSRGKGMPASLEELNYYAQNSGVSDRDFNVRWTNEGERELLGVVFEIKGYDEKGKALKDENGKARVIYYEAFPGYAVWPGEDSTFYHFTLGSKYPWIGEAAYIEAGIVQAIAKDGTVYEEKKPVALKASFLGKKAYAFGNSKNADLKKLEKDIRSALKKEGIKYSEAEIYERENDFAVFRYDDLDVRVELGEKGKVSQDCVSFAYYFYYSDYEARLDEKGVDRRQESIAVCIYSSVLKDLKAKEIKEKVKEFYENTESYIDFEDKTYDTFEDASVIVDPEGNLLLCSINGVGRDFDYYPSNALFWAYDTIYSSERYKTVPKRPQ